jgi:hypothetical protein
MAYYTQTFETNIQGLAKDQNNSPGEDASKYRRSYEITIILPKFSLLISYIFAISHS